MKAGMMNNPRVDLLTEIAWAHQNRFEFLDLTMEPSAAHPKQVKVKKTRQALRDRNLGIVGHTAYYLPASLSSRKPAQSGLERDGLGPRRSC